MQFYFLGNRHYSVPVILTVALCFFLMPEHWSVFKDEFKKGRKGKPFTEVDFGSIVIMKTKELRKQFIN
ncbi:MAG: hypothetical protein H0W84_06750 [Bacteroidetes bacterium]|nr:hypothetical protein [Bacteroidota bacterium]